MTLIYADTHTEEQSRNEQSVDDRDHVRPPNLVAQPRAMDGIPFRFRV